MNENLQGTNPAGDVRTDDPSQAPMSELLRQLSRDAALLFRQELELGKAEVRSNISSVKRGLAKAATAAMVTYLGALALTAALIIALSEVMAAWLAAALVGVLLVVFGAIMRGSAKKDAEEATSIETTENNVKRDIRAAKEAAR